jgi:hypothetical protein
MFDPSQETAGSEYAEAPIKIASAWQSSETSVAAFWLAVDPESGVAEYEWNIGSNTEAGVYMPWRSSGTNVSAVEYGLELQHLGQYCVQVRATNGADLATISNRACVKVDNTAPEMTKAFVRPIKYNRLVAGSCAVSYGDDVPVSVTYGGATDPESGIHSYKVAFGVTPGGDELLPLSPLSDKEGANVTLKASTVFAVRLGDTTTKESEVTAEMPLAEAIGIVDAGFELKLQRGARHFWTMAAVNEAQAQTNLTSIPIVLTGPVQHTHFLENEQSSVELPLSSFDAAAAPAGHPQKGTAVDQRLQKLKVSARCGNAMAVGVLSDAEVAATYTSANANANFVPYIQPPAELTLATSSRSLRKRTLGTDHMGLNVFVAPLSKDGATCSVELTIDHSAIAGAGIEGSDAEHDMYGLVYWDTATSLWTEVSGSCNGQPRTRTATGSTYQLCAGGLPAGLGDTVQVSAFHMRGPVQNTAPVVDANTAVTTRENTPSAPIRIAYTDAELDDVVFSIREDAAVQSAGRAEITSDGNFTFHPAFAFHGQVTVTVTVTEVLPASLETQPLSAQATVTITVIDAPTNPTLARLAPDGASAEVGVRTFAVGPPGGVAVLSFMLVDFDGDAVALLEKGAPAGSKFESFQVSKNKARQLAAMEHARRCIVQGKVTAPCEYPWSIFDTDVLNPAAFIVNATIPMSKTGDSAASFELIAKDSSGEFSEDTLVVDIVSCAAGTFYSPGTAKTCTTWTVCKDYEQLVREPSSIWDRECFDPFGPGQNRTGASSAGTDSDAGSTVVLAVLLALVFLIILAVLAWTTYKREQVKEIASFGSIDQNHTNGQLFQNPMFAAQSGASNPLYSVPFDNGAYGAVGAAAGVPVVAGASNPLYAVPMGDGSNDQAFIMQVDKPSAESQYAIPFDEGVSNPLYSVPMAAEEGLYAVPMATTSEGVYSLVPRAEALEGIYGSAASGGTMEAPAFFPEEDIYGYARGTDANAEQLHSQPPWLFSAAMDRVGAEEIIAQHGNAPGTFLVRNKGREAFALSMRSQTGFDHHILQRKSGSFVLNKQTLEGVATLEQTVSLLSGDKGDELLKQRLTAAVCIPRKSSSTGTPLWIHGALEPEVAERLLLGKGGGALGLFLAYDNGGKRLLAVVESEGGVVHKVVSQAEAGHGLDDLDGDASTDGLFRLDGAVVESGSGKVASDWASLREILSQPNTHYATPLTKGVCRAITPPERLSEDGSRPRGLFGAIPRDTAQHLLDGAGPGAFLVRESLTSAEQYKLSHNKANGGVAHQLLEYSGSAEWLVSGTPVDYAMTLTDLIDACKDKSRSGLKFELTNGIECEPDYLVVPAAQAATADVTPATDGGNDVYLANDALVSYTVEGGALDATYMDDLCLMPDAAGDAAHIYSTAAAPGQSSEYIVLGNGSEDIYNVAAGGGGGSGGQYVTTGAKPDLYVTVGRAPDTGYMAPQGVQVAGTDGGIYAVPAAAAAAATVAGQPEMYVTVGQQDDGLYAAVGEAADGAAYSTAADAGMEVRLGGDSQIYAVPTEGGGLAAARQSSYGAAVDPVNRLGTDGGIYSVPTEAAGEGVYAAPDEGAPTTGRKTSYNAAVDAGAGDGTMRGRAWTFNRIDDDEAAAGAVSTASKRKSWFGGKGKSDAEPSAGRKASYTEATYGDDAYGAMGVAAYDNGEAGAPATYSVPTDDGGAVYASADAMPAGQDARRQVTNRLEDEVFVPDPARAVAYGTGDGGVYNVPTEGGVYNVPTEGGDGVYSVSTEAAGVYAAPSETEPGQIARRQAPLGFARERAVTKRLTDGDVDAFIPNPDHRAAGAPTMIPNPNRARGYMNTTLDPAGGLVVNLGDAPAESTTEFQLSGQIARRQVTKRLAGGDIDAFIPNPDHRAAGAPTMIPNPNRARGYMNTVLDPAGGLAVNLGDTPTESSADGPVQDGVVAGYLSVEAPNRARGYMNTTLDPAGGLLVNLGDVPAESSADGVPVQDGVVAESEM